MFSLIVSQSVLAGKPAASTARVRSVGATWPCAEVTTRAWRVAKLTDAWTWQKTAGKPAKVRLQHLHHGKGDQTATIFTDEMHSWGHTPEIILRFAGCVLIYENTAVVDHDSLFEAVSSIALYLLLFTRAVNAAFLPLCLSAHVLVHRV